MFVYFRSTLLNTLYYMTVSAVNVDLTQFSLDLCYTKQKIKRDGLHD